MEVLVSRKFIATAKVVIFLSIIMSLFRLPYLVPYLSVATQPILMAVIIIVITFTLTHFILKYENETLTDLGLNWKTAPLNNILIGAFAGLLTISIMFFVLFSFSELSFKTLESTSVLSFLSFSIINLLILAFMEEFIFRGYLLFKLKQLFGIRIAIYVTSIIFGLYHGVNVDSLLGPAIWGLIFGWLAIKSKGLALPTAFHFALNWGQSVFNMKERYVSGPYELVLSEKTPFIPSQTLGMLFQVVVLIVAVILIEHLIHQEKGYKR